jgi:AraC-like DNA-binding protein
MVNNTPLDPRLVNLISDMQWTAYRIFGVTSQLKSPGLAPEEDAWDWHRPWFCFHLHYGRHDPSERSTMAPIHLRCERLKAALIRRSAATPAFGECGSGLRLVSLPLRWNNRTVANLLLGPYSNRELPPSFSRNIAARTGFDDPEHLAWCARQLPVLDRLEEKEMLSWFSSTTTRLMARFGCLLDGAPWEEAIGTAWEQLYAPVRLADDSPASIFGVFGWPFETEPSVTPRATRGNFWELLFVERGNLEIEAGTTAIGLSAGQACIFPPGRDYACRRNSQHAAGIQMTFIGQAGIFSSLALRPITLRARDREDLRDMCETLFAKPEGSRDSSVRVNLLHFLLNLRRGFSMPLKDLSLTGPAARDRRHYAVAAARRYMEEHVMDSLSIDEVARHCETSVSTLAHTFKELTGVSPLQYHLRLKFELAKILLRDGSNTTTSVAEKLNFADTAHFSRTFKKMSGTSPSRFARSVKPLPGK